MLHDYPLIHSLLQTDCSYVLCCCTSFLSLRTVIRMFHVAAAASLIADILTTDYCCVLCCCTTFLNLNVYHCVQCHSCASVMRLCCVNMVHAVPCHAIHMDLSDNCGCLVFCVTSVQHAVVHIHGTCCIYYLIEYLGHYRDTLR